MKILLIIYYRTYFILIERFNIMGKNKKTKQKKKNNFHYDVNSFFLDDVLKEIKERHKEKKKSGFSN